MACLECRRRRIRCDNAKPSCGHCTRLSKQCEYAVCEQRRGRKKKSVKQLEDRLAVVEAQLSASKASNSPNDSLLQDSSIDAPSSPSTTANGNSRRVIPKSTMALTVTEDVDFSNMEFDFQHDTAGQDWFDATNSTTPSLALDLSSHSPSFDPGLDKFPELDEVQELNDLFFDYVYPCVPIVHPRNHGSDRGFQPDEQPPLCLRYAMWAPAAMRSPKFADRGLQFYRNARMHLEHDEMEGDGQGCATLAHVQSLALIATFEAANGMSARAFLSYRRALSLSHLLELHSLDDSSTSLERSYRVLRPSRDPIEAEERRRTFWYLYFSDRWSGASTGKTIAIREQEIKTFMPASEDAFQQGYVESTQELSDAVSMGLLATASPLSAAVLSARILEKCANHLRQVPSVNNTKTEQEFWFRHQQLDDEISRFLLDLPEHLTSSRTKSPLALFVNMCIQAFSISLFQAAIAIADDSESSKENQNRLYMRMRRCAVEIVDIVRCASSLSIKRWFAFTPFLLYKSCFVFIDNVLRSYDVEQSKQHLRFIIQTAKGFRKYWKPTQMVIVQILENVKKNNLDIGMEFDAADATPLTYWSNKRDDFDALGPIFSIEGLLNQRSRNKTSLTS